MKELKLLPMLLTLFSTTTQTTLLNGLSDEMKTFYSDYLIDNAKPQLVHDQFAQKHNIPKNGGKTIEFRKYSPLAKATTALTEGVTPDGNSLTVSTVSATVAQYGDWIRLSDVLLLTAIDNNLVQATALLGDQAGRTADTITREVINAGTNVMFAPNGSTAISARSSITGDSKLTVDCVMKAAAQLKTMNTKTINGSYVAIIHPYVAYDLMSDTRWIDAHKYATPENIYEGEIGKIGNVRFVETSEAKIWALAGAATTANDDTTKVSVYSTLVLGDNAYGTTEIEGGGLQHIVKQLGSSGTEDPLNQRASAGWKLIKVAKILVEAYMIRIESCSTYSTTAAN